MDSCCSGEDHRAPYSVSGTLAGVALMAVVDKVARMAPGQEAVGHLEASVVSYPLWMALSCRRVDWLCCRVLHQIVVWRPTMASSIWLLSLGGLRRARCTCQGASTPAVELVPDTKQLGDFISAAILKRACIQTLAPLPPTHSLARSMVFELSIDFLAIDFE